MTDAALRNALARRDGIAAEINSVQQRVEELRAELVEVDRFIQAWHEFAGVPFDGKEQPENDTANVLSAKPVKRPRATGNPPREEVAERVRELIKARNEALSRDALYAGLQADGIKIKGADPKMVLSTMLWRSKDRIVRVKTPKGHRYWLAEVPNADIGYDPNPPETEAEFQVRMDQGLTEAAEAGLIKHPFNR